MGEKLRGGYRTFSGGGAEFVAYVKNQIFGNLKRVFRLFSK